MIQVRLLKILNPLLMISFLFQFATVFIEPIAEYHAINGFIFFGLVLAHVFLNRGWIINSFFKKRK